MFPFTVPLVYPAAFIILGIGAWWKKTGNKTPKGLTAERELLYNNAMTDERDPVKLRKIADLFDQDPTLRPQAAMLRKRADLADAPEDIKEQRREAFRKGLRATDPDKVEVLATAYEKSGALGSAKALRIYAKGLRLTDILEIEKLAAQLDKGDNERVGAESLRARAEQLRNPPQEHAEEHAEEKPETIPAPPPEAAKAAE